VATAFHLPAWLPLRGRIERGLRMVAPALERVAEVAFLQSAVVMAAQTFLALFPLLIVVIALAPSSLVSSISDVAGRRLGLSGHTSDEMGHLVASRDDLRGTLTVLGVIVVLGSATSFTRALQRVYENAWRLPRAGLRGSIRGLAWLIGLIAYLGLLGVAVRLTASPAAAVSLLRWVVQIAAALLLWWFTPFILLCGRVRLRALAFTGLLTAVVVIVAGVLSAAIMPRVIAGNERQYGTIGAAFAIESWLVVMSALIVGCTILGALAAQADSVIGRWTRGRTDPDGWRRAVKERRVATTR
jgi:membrane protein